MDRRKKKAISMLRDLNSEYALVHVQFGPTSARPTAREIADLLELAEWRCRFADVAQENIPGYPHREGIEVSGVNGYFVDIVAETLADAGLPGVRPIVKPNVISPANPKYKHVVREVEVHVGHPALPKPERRRKALSVATAGAIIPIAVGIVTEFATDWKTNTVAWLVIAVLTIMSIAYIYGERRGKG